MNVDNKSRLTPTEADIAMTTEIGAKLGITLHRHVVAAKGGFRSLKALP